MTSPSPIWVQLKELVLQSRSWVHSADAESENTHPIVSLLQSKRKETQGWLRAVLPKKNRTEKKQLGSNEVAVMCNIYSTLTGISTGWNADFAHAWGISTRSIRNVFDRFVERDFNGERKERSDKGLTIFNSEQKRKAVFTLEMSQTV